VLAVAGKGHEQGQTIGGVTLPFDDVETVRRLVGDATPPPGPLPQGEGVT
jgi:UDP-N-acetylmuramoyl-L-alanyl-D-glutamate--2,6-diaminopimelate ligase